MGRLCVWHSRGVQTAGPAPVRSRRRQTSPPRCIWSEGRPGWVRPVAFACSVPATLWLASTHDPAQSSWELYRTVTVDAVSGEGTGLEVKWPKVTQLIIDEPGSELRTCRSEGLISWPLGICLLLSGYARQADCQVCLHGLICSWNVLYHLKKGANNPEG